MEEILPSVSILLNVSGTRLPLKGMLLASFILMSCSVDSTRPEVKVGSSFEHVIHTDIGLILVSKQTRYPLFTCGVRDLMDGSRSLVVQIPVGVKKMSIGPPTSY